MVDLIGFTCLHHQSRLGTLRKVVMYAATSSEGTRHDPLRTDSTVRKDDDLDTFVNSFLRFSVDTIETGLVTWKTFVYGKRDVDCVGGPFVVP